MQLSCVFKGQKTLTENCSPTCHWNFASLYLPLSGKELGFLVILLEPNMVDHFTDVMIIEKRQFTCLSSNTSHSHNYRHLS
jgi:hypothetical protein